MELGTKEALPPEYVDVLGAVIECLAADPLTPLRTAEEITEWLRNIQVSAVEKAAAKNSNRTLLDRTVKCLLEKTHHPLLHDWTPEQITDWCHRTRLSDVQAVLRERSP